MRFSTITFHMLKAATLSLLTTVAFAHPGDLDKSFGGSGMITTSMPIAGTIYSPASVAIDHDNRIIVAGTIVGSGSTAFIHVKNSVGATDLSFGSGGFVTTNLGGVQAEIYAMAIDDHNRIVVAGRAYPGGYMYGMVARFLSNGDLDTSFGSGGISLLSSSSMTPSGVVIGSGGGSTLALTSDIYVVGTTSGSETLMAVAKMDDMGKFDSRFGTGGIATLHLAPFHEWSTASSIVVDNAGSVYATGFTETSPRIKVSSTIKLTATGGLDASFGGGKGFVQTALFPTSENYAYTKSIAVDNTGRIVVAGGADTRTSGSDAGSFFAIRYMPDGSLDTAFNGTGIFLSPAISGVQQAQQVSIDGRGAIILTGWSSLDGKASNTQVEVMRLSSNGVLDPAFGIGGKVALGYIASTGSGASALTRGNDIMILAADSSSSYLIQENVVNYDPLGVGFPPSFP